MTESIKDAKRFKLFDEVFIWFGKNKMTLGETDSGEHLTMLVTKEGILDIHKTLEGSEKKYESLMKIDLKDVAEIIKNPDFKKNFENDIKNNIQEIDFTESEFSECKIILVKNDEEMNSLARKVKRTIVLDENTINESELIPWFEAKDRVKEKALVLDKKGSSTGYLFNNGEKIYYMKGDYMMKSYFSQLIQNLASNSTLD